MQGSFDEIGQLFFPIELISASDEPILVDGLFDTGFNGWLAMSQQDVFELQWDRLPSTQTMRTARGDWEFDLYVGRVIFNDRRLTIPVLADDPISEIILGLRWLENYRLVVDYAALILTID